MQISQLKMIGLTLGMFSIVGATSLILSGNRNTFAQNIPGPNARLVLELEAGSSREGKDAKVVSYIVGTHTCVSSFIHVRGTEGSGTSTACFKTSE